VCPIDPRVAQGEQKPASLPAFRADRSLRRGPEGLRDIAKRTEDKKTLKTEGRRTRMGAEAACRMTFKGKTTSGKARLESDTLQFRGGEVRLSIPFGQVSRISSRDGMLSVTSPEGTASFELGAPASRWAQKIRHPPSRLEKIGAKPEWKASAIGVEDQSFLDELEHAIAELTVGRVVRNADAIFFGATNASNLARLARLKTLLKPNGALWVIRPKGRPEISERAVMAAGKAAGLVDVKVVAFSPTHTAEKFVIPVSQRG
jgi:hypothetical protein